MQIIQVKWAALPSPLFFFSSFFRFSSRFTSVLEEVIAFKIEEKKERGEEEEEEASS